jgi:hypothetical protein
MNRLLILCCICCMIACSPRVYLPNYPAVIDCSHRNASHIMKEIADTYNIKVVFAENFDTLTPGTLGWGSFAVRDVSLDVLLGCLNNDRVTFHRVHRTIYVSAPSEPSTYIEPMDQHFWKKY